jgi:hypothetical protein
VHNSYDLVIDKFRLGCFTPTFVASRPRKVAKMNDPGLDKPISDEAKDIENQIGRAKKEDEAEEQALLAPR